MQSVVTVTLQPELNKKLEQSIKTQKITRNEIINRALEQYLFQDETDQIRKKLQPYAKRAGFFTDEDVFREIS